MPKNNPTPELRNTPIAATHVCTAAGNGVYVRSASATKNPKEMPKAPPAIHCMTLSTINCRRMSRFVAPTARRTPISLRRRFTLTSITFMMTIPPMTTDMALTRMNTPKNAELILRKDAADFLYDPDHHEFVVPDAKALPDGIHAEKQLLHQRVADQADVSPVLSFHRREVAAKLYGARVNIRHARR